LDWEHLARKGNSEEALASPLAITSIHKGENLNYWKKEAHCPKKLVSSLNRIGRLSPVEVRRCTREERRGGKI